MEHCLGNNTVQFQIICLTWLNLLLTDLELLILFPTLLRFSQNSQTDISDIVVLKKCMAIFVVLNLDRTF